MIGLSEDQVWEIARRVCTAAELEVLTTREHLARAGRDHGYRSIADQLGIAWTTVRDRVVRAEARIRREAGA